MSPTHPPPLKPTIYIATFIHTPKLNDLQVLPYTAVFVNTKGVIAKIETMPEGFGGGFDAWIEGVRGTAKDIEGGDGVEWEVVRFDEMSGVSGLGEGLVRRRWVFPGFVDTHTHPSQHPNSGIFGKSTLLNWLTTYTFPLESSLSSPQKARTVYTSAISSLLKHGTTCAALYATISAPSTNILASLCLTRGLRAFIGRCNMDTDLQPEYYRDSSAEVALKDTEETVRYIKEIDPGFGLVSPIITPRFAPSCSPALLSHLGSLAQKESLPIQTHISENTNEIALVAQLFPSHPSYAGVYDAHNLLTSRTVLAHGVHLTASERALIKERGSSISHCPVSNSSLSSGICRVRRLLDEGIKVGLGTDVSGGYSASILTAAREAGIVSRILAGQVGPDGSDRPIPVDDPKVRERVAELEEKEMEGSGGGEVKEVVDQRERIKLAPEECLYLATLGGAACLGLEGRIGSFEVGKEFDAQVVEVEEVVEEEAVEAVEKISEEVAAKANDGAAGRGGDEDQGVVQFWGKEDWSDRIAKWVFCGDDRNTRRVFVRGRCVWERKG